MKFMLPPICASTREHSAVPAFPQILTPPRPKSRKTIRTDQSNQPTQKLLVASEAAVSEGVQKSELPPVQPHNRFSTTGQTKPNMEREGLFRSSPNQEFIQKYNLPKDENKTSTNSPGFCTDRLVIHLTTAIGNKEKTCEEQTPTS